MGCQDGDPLTPCDPMARSRARDAVEAHGRRVARSSQGPSLTPLNTSTAPPTIWNAEKGATGCQSRRSGPALRLLRKDSNNNTDRSRRRKGSVLGPDLELLGALLRLMCRAGWKHVPAPPGWRGRRPSCPWTGRLGVSVSFLFDWRAWLGSPPNFWGEYSFVFPSTERPPSRHEMSISRKHKKLLIIKMLSDYSDELHSNLLSSFHNLRKL